MRVCVPGATSRLDEFPIHGMEHSARFLPGTGLVTRCGTKVDFA